MKKSAMIMMTVLISAPGFLLAAAALPDPTRPADYISIPENIVIEELPEELIDWSVTAIRIAGSDRSAIVNGRLVREGDEIGPAKILEIQPVSIVLNYNEQQVIVRLFNNMVQKKMREKH